MTTQERLQNLYAVFNARDIEAVLANLNPNVRWANGWEGGFICGREFVRKYWVRQFEQIRPQVEITHFETDDQNRAVLAVHQRVYDLKGSLLMEQNVGHRFTFENDLVTLFEIVAPRP